MNLKPYPAYKDSGVPWLGEIPAHWEVRKTKFLFSERVQKGFPDEPLLAATQTKGVIPKTHYETRTVTAQKDLHLLKLVEIGDFVISLRSFQGGIEYAYYRGIISPAYTVMRPGSEISSDYFRHLAKSKPFISLLQMCVTGIREGQNVDYGQLRNAYLPLPSEEEQTAIARFLDWQTARINKFIRNKRRLIALLKEQKQNVINQAVTRGINPGVPLKPSGVEWIGDIPAHWEVRKFKHSAKFISGGTPTKAVKEFWNGHIPWVSPKDMKQLFISDSEDHISDKAIAESATTLLPIGNLLIVVRSGILRHSIPVAINTSVVALNQDIKGVLPDKNIYYPQFLMELISGCQAQLLMEWRKDGATVESLEHKLMASCYLPVPPLDEQHLITAYLAEIHHHYNFIISRAEREIELIREYRTRLIADVVTGKVDVRGIAVEAVPEEELMEAEVDDTEEPVSEEDMVEEEAA